MQKFHVETPARFGLPGFLLAVASLSVILIQLSAYFQPAEASSATVIGEFAAEIRKSAEGALSGERAPAPVPKPLRIALIVNVVALVAAGVAIVLGGMGLYRNGPHRLSCLALGIGTSTFLVQCVFWLAILICGVVLLVSVIENLGDIFDGWS